MHSRTNRSEKRSANNGHPIAAQLNCASAIIELLTGYGLSNKDTDLSLHHVCLPWSVEERQSGDRELIQNVDWASAFGPHLKYLVEIKCGNTFTHRNNMWTTTDHSYIRIMGMNFTRRFYITCHPPVSIPFAQEFGDNGLCAALCARAENRWTVNAPRLHTE